MKFGDLFSAFKNKGKEYYKPEKENVLVTGGAGFIGANLCNRLIKEGKNVICVDSLEGEASVQNIKSLLQKPNFKFIKQDINQPFNFENFPELEDFKVDVYGIQKVYHLAVPTSAKKFNQLKFQTLYTNSIGTINMLEMARHFNAKFLLASSFVIYGERGDRPFKESDFGRVDPVGTRSCFDEGKRFSESAVATYRQKYKSFDAKIARIFRTYGPKQPLLDGQMIPDFGLQALTGKPLVIYGNKSFSTSLCYIDDMVDGMVRLMNSDKKGPINLGSEKVYKLADLAEKIIKMTDSDSKIKFKKPLPFMRPLGIPNITKAKKELDWFPVTGLDQGLNKMIEYLKAHRMLLKPMAEKYEDK